MIRNTNNKCIYCLKEFSDLGKEHIPNKAFGLYGDRTWTLKEVCSECNQLFGRGIDSSLARDTIEGTMRFDCGVAVPTENFDITQLTMKIDEGIYKGAEVKVKYVARKNQPEFTFPPQVGFRKVNGEYEYKKLCEIPEKEVINQKYQVSGNEAMIIIHNSQDEYNSCIIALDSKNIKFNREHNPTIHSESLLIEKSRAIDNTIKRAMGKIGFNYFAYNFLNHGNFDRLLIYDKQFNEIRNFVLKGEDLDSLNFNMYNNSLVSLNLKNAVDSLTSRISPSNFYQHFYFY